MGRCSLIRLNSAQFSNFPAILLTQSKMAAPMASTKTEVRNIGMWPRKTYNFDAILLIVKHFHI